MYYCSKCGVQLDENMQYCSNCGAQIHPIDQDPTPVEQPTYRPTPPLTADNFQMKWFKFLIYFSLFAGALLNLVNGVNLITGNIYLTQSNGQVTADMVYGVYGSSLKTLDLVYGVIMVLIAVFSIYTRVRLAKFKANGPMCLYILYGAPVAFSILYNVAVSGIIGQSAFNAQIIGSAVTSIGMLLLNYAYFTKRKVLFVN